MDHPKKVNEKTRLLALLLFFSALGACADEAHVKQGDLFYSWIDGLRMNDDSGKAAVTLNKYDFVMFAGKFSDKKETVSLQGKEYKSPYYFVKTNNGKSGWVFGGALKPIVVDEKKKDAAVLGFQMSSSTSLTTKMASNKQKVINGAEISSYEKTLTYGDVVYKRPVYESGCLGLLEEKCYANNIIVTEREGGSVTLLYGDFVPLLGITKGMSKDLVVKKLGVPSRRGNDVFVYSASYVNKHKDGDVPMEYEVWVFFDDAQKVKLLKMSVSYNEDC
jgi:hypothetical protein